MATKFTQEDLNAINQGIRLFRFLERVEPMLRNALALEEQGAKAQSEFNAAVKERDQVRLDIVQVREDHNKQLRAMEAEKKALRENIINETENERLRLRAKLKDDMAEETTKAEAALKKLIENMAAEEKSIATKRRLSMELADKIDSLEQQRYDLETAVSQLAEKAEQNKKKIRDMVEQLAAQE